MTTNPPLVIWGAGAIGGTIGAHLARAGHEVLLVDRAAEHVDAIRKSGLSITGPVSSFTVAVSACLPEELTGPQRRVLLSVKSQDTVEAVKALAPRLADDGYIVSFQNGLNEPVIADLVGAARTIGAFINFGADYISPGVIHFGGRGAVVIGEVDGRITPRSEALHRALKDFDGNAVLTENIYGYLWAKQAYASLLKANALTNASIVEFLESKPHREMLTAMVREVIAAARANGITLKAFDGFDPDAFDDKNGPAGLARCFEAMIAVNRKSAKSHSGIWRDIAVRKRRTEVAAQLTPVIQMGTAKGVAMPLTRRLVELFREVEDGERPQGWETLDALSETYAKAAKAGRAPAA